MAKPLQVERTTTHDTFTGEVAALVEAGVIEQRQLEPQPGRRKGYVAFMPDGSPVPEGVTPPNSLPGVLVVRVRSDGTCTARRAVTLEEREAREDAEPTLRRDWGEQKYYAGSRERLLRDGIPERWLVDHRAPGKQRGWRTFYEAEKKIEVSFTETGISLQVTHIDYYKDLKRDLYLRMRAEYGLPLTVKKHLTLVWSAPQ